MRNDTWVAKHKRRELFLPINAGYAPVNSIAMAKQWARRDLCLIWILDYTILAGERGLCRYGSKDWEPVRIGVIPQRKKVKRAK